MRTLLLAVTLCFIATSSHAEVIARPVNLVLSEPQQKIDIDVDNNGVVDFQLFYDVYQDEPFLHINVPVALQSTNKIVVTGEHNTFGKDLVDGLPLGANVYQGSEYNGQIFGNGPLMAQPDFAGFNILEGQGPKFVGFSFARSGEIHYGWMVVEVNQSGTRAAVSALAYESVADRAIRTGAVPSGVNRPEIRPAIRQVGERLFEVGSEQHVIEVVDLMGRAVARSGGSQLDMKELPAGVYFLRDTDGQAFLKITLP